MIAKGLAYPLRLIPSFSFGYGILNMNNKYLYSVVEGYKPPKDVYDMDISGTDLLFLGFTGFLYYFIIFIIQFLEQKDSFSRLVSKEKSIPSAYLQLDDDV